METIDWAVSFMLGMMSMALYLDYLKGKMSLLPQFTVQKIGDEWFVSNLVRGLSVEDREAVVQILLDEVDTLDHGTKFDFAN